MELANIFEALSKLNETSILLEIDEEKRKEKKAKLVRRLSSNQYFNTSNHTNDGHYKWKEQTKINQEDERAVNETNKHKVLIAKTSESPCALLPAIDEEYLYIKLHPFKATSSRHMEPLQSRSFLNSSYPWNSLLSISDFEKVIREKGLEFFKIAYTSQEDGPRNKNCTIDIRKDFKIDICFFSIDYTSKSCGNSYRQLLSLEEMKPLLSNVDNLIPASQENKFDYVVTKIVKANANKTSIIAQKCDIKNLDEYNSNNDPKPTMEIKS